MVDGAPFSATRIRGAAFSSYPCIALFEITLCSAFGVYIAQHNPAVRRAGGRPRLPAPLGRTKPARERISGS